MLGPQPCQPLFCFWPLQIRCLRETGTLEEQRRCRFPCFLPVDFLSAGGPCECHSSTFFTPSVAVSFIAAANPICSFYKTWRTSLITSISSSWDTTMCWPSTSFQSLSADLTDSFLWARRHQHQPSITFFQHQNPLSNLWSFKHLNLFLSLPQPWGW